MDIEEKLRRVLRNTVEVVTVDELRERFETGQRLKGYLGFEPSGIFHIGWFVWALKYKDLVDVGVDMHLLEATWHAWINDKFGGDMELIRLAARHVEKVLEGLGIDMSKVKIVDAEDMVSDKNYWELLLRVAKSSSLSRIRRALTIMGRKMEEAELDFSKLIYPAMQVTDIFYLDLDIALGGLDQRKAHMLARDVAEKLGRKKPIAIHTPLITSLQGAGRMSFEGEVDVFHAEVKMSKSKPETAIFITDTPEEIRRKLRRAYCPPKVEELNPVMEIAKYIIFYEGEREFHIERPSKYGGPITVYTYDELRKLYVEGKLHPLDLKNAVAEYLIKFLEPIKKRLVATRKDKEELKLLMSRVSR